MGPVYEGTTEFVSKTAIIFFVIVHPGAIEIDQVLFDVLIAFANVGVGRDGRVVRQVWVHECQKRIPTRLVVGKGCVFGHGRQELGHVPDDIDLRT